MSDQAFGRIFDELVTFCACMDGAQLTCTSATTVLSTETPRGERLTQGTSLHSVISFVLQTSSRYWFTPAPMAPGRCRCLLTAAWRGQHAMRACGSVRQGKPPCSEVCTYICQDGCMAVLKKEIGTSGIAKIRVEVNFISGISSYAHTQMYRLHPI